MLQPSYVEDEMNNLDSEDDGKPNKKKATRKVRHFLFIRNQHQLQSEQTAGEEQGAGRSTCQHTSSFGKSKFSVCFA